MSELLNHQASCPKPANFSNGFLRQLCGVFVVPGLSALAHHIRCVVLGCSKKQVTRITAQRIVAMMANAKAVRDFSNFEPVSQPVCGPENVVNAGHAIAVFILCAGPQPTSAQLGFMRRCRSILVEFLPENSRGCDFRHKRKTPTAFESKSANESGIKDSGCKSLVSFMVDALNVSRGQPQPSTL